MGSDRNVQHLDQVVNVNFVVVVHIALLRVMCLPKSLKEVLKCLRLVLRSELNRQIFQLLHSDHLDGKVPAWPDVLL